MLKTTGRVRAPHRALAVAAMAAAGVFGAMPAAASADDVTVARDGATLLVTGTAARDEIGITWSPGPVVAVVNAYKTVVSGAGCTTDSGGAATCAADGVQAVEAHLGDGNDSLLANGGLPVHAYGEGGDDTLYATDAPDMLAPAPVIFDGGPGADHLAGSPLADTLLGGPGDDGIEGNAGDDTIDAGPGRDSVSDFLGHNTIEARDGEPDTIGCAAGTTVFLDAVDSAPGCAPGVAATAGLDCTPEIGPTPATSLRRLRRSRTVALEVTAATGCSLQASLAWRSKVLARANAARHTSRIVLRLSRTAVRRLRPGRLVVTVISSGGGVRTVRRTVNVRVTH